MTIAIKTPITAVPPEWAPQKALWTAWPADSSEWNDDLKAPRQDVAAMVRALSPTNRVRILANGSEAEASARAALGDIADIVPATYGDIWLRDTGPIFARAPQGPVALRFRTNGWGGKFDLAGDHTVGDDIALAAGVQTVPFDFILEGGAIDHDGAGTILATRQTLLNANRNGWTKETAEAALKTALGAEQIIWIDEGLKGDHTDGHVDNVARFVGPARVVCQTPAEQDDPNAAVLEAVAAQLDAATDARGRKLEVVRIPSPGRVLTGAGEVSPASHMNFVIANGVVVMPTYGAPANDAAVEALQALFPDRSVIGIPSHGLLGDGSSGGGSFHCITREEPSL